MKRFDKPPVGSHITVTTRYNDVHIGSDSQWCDNTYYAEVLKPEQWFKPNDFKITSDDPRMSFRVINLEHVIGLKIGEVDGEQSESEGIQIVSIKGSKGNTYSVTIKNGTAVSCDCPGFQFRNRCRHLSEALEQR